MGGGSKTETKTENHDPWWGQQPYLLDAFKDAQNTYKTNKDDPAYTGDFFAAPRSEQTDTLQRALGYSNGQGQANADAMSAAGSSMLQPGMNATTGALSGIAGLSGDNTAIIQGNAERYANSPFADGMITSAMRDANRSVAEGALPTLYRGATASGNINSDRTAIAEGVIGRGLAEKTADVSATIRGGLYDQGLGLASSDIDRRIGALGAQGQMGTGMTAAGAGLIGQGMDAQSGLLDMAGNAADRLQMVDQTKIDNEMSKFEYQQSKPWQALQNYYGIIGDKSWGGTTTSFGKVSDKPSAMSSIGSGIGVLGSLLKLCDERMKNKIKVVGDFMEGIPLWAFTYKGDPTRQVHIGPMAQDVEKHFPDMVVEINGIKHVDYSKL